MAKTSELKLKISADDSQLRKKLEDVKEHAREIGKQIGEVGTDLGKGLTGIDISKLLGLGGAVYAANKLGDALIDAVKEGYKAFQEFQDLVLRTKLSLPVSIVGDDNRQEAATKIVEDAEKHAGAASGVERLKMRGDVKKTFPGLTEEEIEKRVQTLVNLGVSSNQPGTELSEALLNLRIGEKGEKGATMMKFYKRMPQMMAAAEKMQAEEAEKYLQEHPGADTQIGTLQSEHYRDLAGESKESPSQYMTRKGTESGGGEAQLKMVWDMMKAKANPDAEKQYLENNPELLLKARLLELSESIGKIVDGPVGEFTKNLTGLVEAFNGLSTNAKLAEVGLGALAATLTALALGKGVKDLATGTLEKVGEAVAGHATGVMNVEAAVVNIISAGSGGKGIEGHPDFPGKQAAKPGLESPTVPIAPEGFKPPPLVNLGMMSFIGSALLMGEWFKWLDDTFNNGATALKPGETPPTSLAQVMGQAKTAVNPIQYGKDNQPLDIRVDHPSGDSGPAATAGGGIWNPLKPSPLLQPSEPEKTAQIGNVENSEIKALNEKIAAIIARTKLERDIATNLAQYEAKSIDIHNQARTLAYSAVPKSETYFGGAGMTPDLKRREGEESIAVQKQVIGIQEEAAEKINRINEESAKRRIEQAAEAKKVDLARKEEKEKAEISGVGPAELAKINDRIRAENEQTTVQILAANEESARKIAAIHVETAEKIISENQAAALKIIDEQLAAAERAIDAQKGPEGDKGPEAQWDKDHPTYTTYDRTGKPHEGSYERGIREEQNARGQADFEAQQKTKKEQVKAQKKAEADAQEEKERQAKASAQLAAAHQAYLGTPEGQQETAQQYARAHRVILVDKDGKPLPANQQPAPAVDPRTGIVPHLPDSASVTPKAGDIGKLSALIEKSNGYLADIAKAKETADIA